VSKSTKTIACNILRCAGATVANVTAPDQSYRILWRILSMLFPILNAAYTAANLSRRTRWRGEWRALMLEQALTAMAAARPGLKVPIEAEGMEVVSQLLDRGERVILCTGHFALTRAAFGLLEPHRRAVLIADYNEEMYERNWSLKEPLQVLRSGVDVLARALPLLQSGHLLISFVDYRIDYSPEGLTCISPNIFRFAEKADAAVFFFVPQLERDGTIKVRFHQPKPNRFSCAAEANQCAAQFAEFALGHRGWKCIVRRPKSAPATSLNGVFRPIPG
jgi:hypothetical protein